MFSAAYCVGLIVIPRATSVIVNDCACSFFLFKSLLVSDILIHTLCYALSSLYYGRGVSKLVDVPCAKKVAGLVLCTSLV